MSEILSWIDPLGSFQFTIPVDGQGRELGRFREKFIETIEGIEFPAEASRVRKKEGLYFFEIDTDLSRAKLQILAIQTLSKIFQEGGKRMAVVGMMPYSMISLEEVLELAQKGGIAEGDGDKKSLRITYPKSK